MDVIAPVAGRPHVVLQATGQRSPLYIPAEALMAVFRHHGAPLLRTHGWRSCRRPATG